MALPRRPPNSAFTPLLGYKYAPARGKVAQRTASRIKLPYRQNSVLKHTNFRGYLQSKSVLEHVGGSVNYRTIRLRGKRLVLLQDAPEPSNREAVEIEAVEKLLQATNENPDAVAFAYWAGRWVAAA